MADLTLEVAKAKREHDDGLAEKFNKGGPGSGDKLGHEFRGNQHTNGPGSMSVSVGSFAEAKARLDSMGIYIGKTSEALKEDPGSLSAAISEIHDLRSEFGVDPKEIVGIVHIARLPEDALASSQGRHGLLKINGEKDLEWIRQSLADDDKYGHHGGMLDPRAAFRHEIGHSLEHILARKYPDIEEKWSKFWEKSKGRITRVASYARGSKSEAFAELFAIIKYGSSRVKASPVVKEFKQEIYALLKAEMAKSGKKKTKGGPGSGDKDGHEFHGNQYTNNPASPQEAKARIKELNPKVSVQVPKTWDHVATGDMVSEFNSLFEEFPHMRVDTKLTEVGSSLSVPNATFGMVTIDSTGKSLLKMSGAYMEDAKFFAEAVEASSKPTLIEPIPFHDGMTDRRAVIRHELGHIIDHDFLGDPDVEAFKADFFHRAREVSGYAAKNPKELFAECFAIIKYGDEKSKNSDVMKSFRELLDKLRVKSARRSKLHDLQVRRGEKQ